MWFQLKYLLLFKARILAAFWSCSVSHAAEKWICERRFCDVSFLRRLRVIFFTPQPPLLFQEPVQVMANLLEARL
jgi:hypothetical protein